MAAKFPHKITQVTDEEDKIIKKYYKGYIRPFVRVGSPGYLATAGYEDSAADIYNLEVRPDDVWVVAFSRSGTTWLQELIWLVNNNLDFEAASTTPLNRRYAYIEFPTQKSEVNVTGEKFVPAPGITATEHDFRTVSHLRSPRYIKTHLPLSLLPPKLLETSKVFYIARDPRDVAVSFHYMHILFRYFAEGVEFKDFWELFKNDLVLHMPIFSHIEEAWKKRDHSNLQFLFYEEMQKNLLAVIDKVCSFLNKEYSAAQKEKLIEYLSFENMKVKKNNIGQTDKKPDEKSEIKFMRKGKSGNWVNYFSEEMKKEAEEYMEKNLSKTDMRFPTVD